MTDTLQANAVESFSGMAIVRINGVSSGIETVASRREGSGNWSTQLGNLSFRDPQAAAREVCEVIQPTGG